ncbi:MAG: D-alanine--D-alanine ligase [Armatimonadetes bacterium]|nr:D-alanine--D-alanine ligase [Armatimonadota bacterium]
MKKIRVGVIFGGRSGEHEVSVMSARSVIENLDRERYEVIPLAITREGRWLPTREAAAALKAGVAEGGEGALAVLPGSSSSALVAVEGADASIPRLDIVFPVLHGTYGEDGTIQGLLEMAGIPYVGAGVTGSAIGMDKALMKSVWKSEGIPVLPWATVMRGRWESEPDQVVRELVSNPGLPCFIKPANLGSSVGISRADSQEELRQGLALAASYDRKLVVEKAADSPREIELAVLGNDDAEVSVPGEIIHGARFYDYQAKYLQTEGQRIEIPADLDEETSREFQRLALRAYRALDMNGLSRVDFLLDRSGAIYLNEVNTMPGFTPISMYSRLWAASGLPYPKLLDRLIELAMERFRDRQRNLVTRA